MQRHQIKHFIYLPHASALKEKNNHLQAKPLAEVTELQPLEESSAPVD